MNAERIKTDCIHWLLRGGLSFNVNQDTIATEVLFSRNRRKADLLIISKEIHTLEIKSNSDNTRKLKNQLIDYHKTFDKVSIVTTPKHLVKVKEMLLPSTGLIVFDGKEFKIIRAAKRNRTLNKHSLLMFLPKATLMKLYSKSDSHELSVDQIRKRLSKALTIHEIRTAIIKFLKKKYSGLFKLLLKDTGGKIVWDELRGLVGAINRLYV